MIEAIVMTLIYVCLVAIVIYLIIWVMEQIGVSLPAHVMKLVWVIVALVVVLIIVKQVLPHAGIRMGSLAMSLLT